MSGKKAKKPQNKVSEQRDKSVNLPKTGEANPEELHKDAKPEESIISEQNDSFIPETNINNPTTDPVDYSVHEADTDSTITKEDSIQVSDDEASIEQATEHISITNKSDEKPEKVNSEETNPQEHTKRSFRISFTKNNIIKTLRIICMVGFVIFAALYINETVIQPYRTKKDINLTRDLYHKSVE